MKSQLLKIEKLLDLHACEQEGLESGMPTPKQWYEAVDDAFKALQELKEMMGTPVKTPEEIWGDMPISGLDDFEGHEMLTIEEAYELAEKYAAQFFATAIKAKALRKKGTDKWYHPYTHKYSQNIVYTIQDSVHLFPADYEFGKDDNLPSDAVLVDILIIQKP